MDRKRVILLLFPAPQEGEWLVEWWGAMLPPSETPRIRAPLSRARQMYESAREAIEKRSPDSYKRGRELDARMSLLCQGAAAKPTAERLAEVTQLVQGQDIEAISTALLTDIGGDAHRSWSVSHLWHEVQGSEWERRKEEIVPLARTRIREILSAADVDAAFIERYLSHLPERELWSFVSPPFESPMCAYELTGEDLTTEFILNSHLYDVGQMRNIYIMNCERAATMQPERLREVIPRLWSYDDEDVRWMVARAIVEFPGDEFLKLLSDNFAAGDDIGLGAVGTLNDESRIASRLVALLGLAKPEDEARLWCAIKDHGKESRLYSSSRGNQYFPEALIAHAHERLKELEADPSEQAQRTAAAIRTYIAEAGQ